MGCESHLARSRRQRFLLTTAQSGVSYDLLGRTNDDENADDCLRSTQAYAVRLSEDDSWVPNGQSQDFNFQACARTQISQVYDTSSQGHSQLGDIQANVDMILLQVGGGDANLAAIVYACIIAPEGNDWGPDYPDPRGKCYQEIGKADSYLSGGSTAKLVRDVRATVNAIFHHDKVKNNAKFRLFVPGYFQFFYEDGGVGDWCDNASFALRSENRPPLNIALRKKINELVRALNSGLKAGIAASDRTGRSHFIDVDTEVTGHRFCQPGHTLYDQYYSDQVYLWNLSPEGVVIRNPGSGSIDTSNDTYEVREPTPEEFDHWRQTGSFTTDPQEVPLNLTFIANEGLAHDQVDTRNDRGWQNHTGAMSNSLGIALRVFTPNEFGHTAMASAIASAIKHHYVDTSRIATGSDKYPNWSVGQAG